VPAAEQIATPSVLASACLPTSRVGQPRAGVPGSRRCGDTAEAGEERCAACVRRRLDFGEAGEQRDGQVGVDERLEVGALFEDAEDAGGADGGTCVEAMVIIRALGCRLHNVCMVCVWCV